jgi:hypothetical protein
VAAQKLAEVQIESLDGAVAGLSANYSVERHWQMKNIPLDSCSSLLLIDIRMYFQFQTEVLHTRLWNGVVIHIKVRLSFEGHRLVRELRLG